MMRYKLVEHVSQQVGYRNDSEKAEKHYGNYILIFVIKLQIGRLKKKLNL